MRNQTTQLFMGKGLIDTYQKRYADRKNAHEKIINIISY